MADTTTSPRVADTGRSAVMPAFPLRAFPDDFPELKDCRDGPKLAAAITGAAATLTSVDLSGG